MNTVALFNMLSQLCLVGVAYFALMSILVTFQFGRELFSPNPDLPERLWGQGMNIVWLTVFIILHIHLPSLGQ